MANYATLKAAIAAAIKQNGDHKITGTLLQQQLLAMVNSLGAGYQYVGIATSATNPGTPDQNVFYIASTAGTYANFGGLVLADGEIAILKYNGAWSKDSTGVVSLEMFNEIGQKITNNGYVDTSGQTHLTGASWRYSNLIPVAAGMKYKLSGYGTNAVSMIAFYDINQNFISGLSGQSASLQQENFNGTIPQDSAFVRVCVNVGGYEQCQYVFQIENYASEEFFAIVSNQNKAIFTINSFPNNGYFGTNGSVTVTVAWKYTNFLLVEPGTPYVVRAEHLQNTTPVIIFYDNNFEILENGIIGVNENSGFLTYNGTVPAGARYARVCTKGDSTTLANSNIVLQISQRYVNGVIADIDLRVSQYDNTIAELTRKAKRFTSFVDKPFSFSGKTAAFFGDSITYGVASDPLRLIENCYRKVLCDTIGLTPTNYAVSGSYVCDPTDSQESITNRVLTQITSSNIFDFVFIMGGTNDYWTGKPLGQLGDSTKATFYGSLKVICEHLATTIPSTTKVVFFVPINCSRSETSAVAPIESYRQAIYEIASMYGYNVVDTSDICFPDKYMPTNIYWQTMIADGVHPTELGHKILGKNLAAKLL